MAAELNPDLVLLDVGLPIVNGVEAAAKIHAVAPNAKLMFLTQHDSPDFVRAALRAGALGYVLKLDVGSELLQAATGGGSRRTVPQFRHPALTCRQCLNRM